MFYVLRSGFKAVWDDGLEDWKSLVVMSLVALFAALTVACLVSIGFQHRVFLPHDKHQFSVLWITVGAGIVCFNNYTLISGRKWARFEREFQHHTKTMLFCSAAAIWLCVVLVVLAAEWAGSIARKLP